MLIDWEKFALFNNYGQTYQIYNNNNNYHIQIGQY